MARWWPGHRYTSGPGKYRRPPGRKGGEWPAGSLPPSCPVPDGAPQSGEGGAVIAAKVEALAAIGHSADQDRFIRPEIVGRIALGTLLVDIAFDGHQVEDSGGEMTDFTAFLVRHVARHGQGLEVDFGGHDGGAEGEQEAVFQALDGFGEDQEIAVAGFAEGRSVAVGMFVQDVVPHAGVDRDRDGETPGSGEDAQAAVGKIARGDA